ncbi:hypothetical protein Poli38472_002736 [Pythium oligandrum]|uniref:Uncharacterized protein n=1 Tax=Pythium oligandrum TaxID=41045 RepID=A0A8K1FHD7_PYTOL|nr:hypothetical protein Poli38472_002736 [Pythium oligandrum]|eukprot:TMW63795.1 hypothetical protein Poli38472_002736 [Pythium oligandrum]
MDDDDQDQSVLGDESYELDEAPGSLMPNYMRPNFSSLLPEYANAETDQIRSAFTTNNFTSLHKLPSKLAPNAVTAGRFEQMDENRLQGVAPAKIVTKNGLFNAFEYTPSRYSLADELAQMERIESEAKRQSISGQDFVSTSDPKRLKYEDPFGDLQQTYPHLHEPYPDLRDEERHRKWLEDKKILHGAFVPSGHRLDVEYTITKLILPEILQQIHSVLATDWPHVEFSIAPTDDELLAVRFSEATLESEAGLIAYMNVFIRSHRLALKYKLHKVAEDWNAKPGDGGLYFVMRPPWAKNHSTNTRASR